MNDGKAYRSHRSSSDPVFVDYWSSFVFISFNSVIILFLIAYDGVMEYITDRWKGSHID